MALVTVQRNSPNSPVEIANSEGDGEDDEAFNKSDKSECFFAAKGTAVVLTLKDVPQNIERRLSIESIRSTNSTQSNNSDIQLHLQSMFHLLRNEETLQMAVKLESQRPNRTRYIVIASRFCIRNERKSRHLRNSSSAKSSSAIAAAAAAAVATTTATTIASTPPSSSPLLSESVGAAATTSSYKQSLSQDNNKNNATEDKENLQLHSSNNDNNNEVRTQQNTLTANVPTANFNKTNHQHLINANANAKCDADLRHSTATYSTGSRSNIEEEKDEPEGFEEYCLLGIDCNERATIGLVVPILADTSIRLDGDGGFSVSVFKKTHIFKPVSVQAMWSALQTLHKVSKKARENNFYPGGPSHDWTEFYERHIESDQSCLNEWNAMDSLESRRPPSPDAIRNKPTAKEETEIYIKNKLKEIMMCVDLDEVTSKFIRGRLEEHLDVDLGEYKSFIDEEMLIILGQMDAPTEIFEHVYLGSEWNASNLEELQRNGVGHILNVTREIDNFFPGMFDYCNIRVYDDEKTNLLRHWDNTYRYITSAKAKGSKVLVHCKMGVSRSASVVIAYAMKAYNWDFEKALQHVKERRSCIKPNKNFLTQLETYRGMLDAMQNKEKLQRSKSETNLKTSTKDARLLPGSEPTPLIQALNQQSKSKTTNTSGSDSEAASEQETVDVILSDAALFSNESKNLAASRLKNRIDNTRILLNSFNDQRNNFKHRRLVRRSSSTSPTRSINFQNSIGVIAKQQSQSLENLTPERSTADEPKNVRFPGNNGENYSVTQNRVLHIQKTIPQPPPPPPLPPSLLTSSSSSHPVIAAASANNNNTANEQSSLSMNPTMDAASSSTSVRTIVYGLEANQDGKKTSDDRKTLMLQFGRSVSHEQTAKKDNAMRLSSSGASSSGNIISEGPVWNASARLITQTSTLDFSQRGSSLRSSLRCPRTSVGEGTRSQDNRDSFSSGFRDDFRHRRKTQSWAATSGGIVMDTKLGSNSSIDSTSSACTVATAAPATNYEVRVRMHQRELPSRHSSWGSGDNRAGMPWRNSSFSSYDSNRNSTVTNMGNVNATAIYEGKVHDATTSNKTAIAKSDLKQKNQQYQHQHQQKDSQFKQHPHPPQVGGGCVKRTKQKLETNTQMKKLCQETCDADGRSLALEGGGACVGSCSCESSSESSVTSSNTFKKGSNLYRSASAACTSPRSRYPMRCNSDEIVSESSTSSPALTRRSDGSRPLHAADLLSASSTAGYTISDIENRNNLTQSATAADYDDENSVVLRNPNCHVSEDQRVSGNVQILKKNFEAKACVPVTQAAAAPATTTQLTVTTNSTNVIRKGHQSLPSSPMALHVGHCGATSESAATNYFDSTAMAKSAPLATAVVNPEDPKKPSTPISSSTSSSASSSSSVNETVALTAPTVTKTCDRNVKGLVNKYQATNATAGSKRNSAQCSVSTITTATTTKALTNPKLIRPHSYCDSRPTTQKSFNRKSHEYTESRPPPGPSKGHGNIINPSNLRANETNEQQHQHPHQQQQQQQQQQPQSHQHIQQRPLQYGKTHPLARLSLPKQSFNAAAYNTM